MSNDFNPNGPVLEGNEVRFYGQRTKLLDSATKGIVQRWRPGSSLGSFGGAYVYLEHGLVDAAVGVELLDSIAPQVTTAVTHVPVNSPNNDFTGLWVGGPSTPSQATYTHFANYNTPARAELGKWDGVNPAITQYGGGLAPKLPQYDAYDPPLYTRTFKWRIAPPDLTGMRIYAVRLKVKARIQAEMQAAFYATITNPTSQSDFKFVGNVAGYNLTEYVYSWYTCPFDYATTRPWENVDVQRLSSSGNCGIALRVMNMSPTRILGGSWDQFYIDALGVEFVYAPDRRIASAYDIRKIENAYWYQRDSLGNAGYTKQDNKWYYFHIFKTQDDTTEVRIPVLKYYGTPATNPSDDFTEHRHIFETTNSLPGLISSYTESENEMIPLVPHRGPASRIPWNAQPYSMTKPMDLYQGSVWPSGTGIKHTLSQTQNYGAMRLPMKWASTTRPDAPLSFEIRRSTPTGVLLTTATIEPDDYKNMADWTDAQIPFDNPLSNFLAGDYYVVPVPTQATQGRHWQIMWAGTFIPIPSSTPGTNFNSTQITTEFREGMYDLGNYYYGSVPSLLLTAPENPTFVVDASLYASAGYTLVDWTSTSSDQRFLSWEVDRRALGDPSWTTLVTISNSTIKTWEDWTAGSNIEYEYRVRQVTTLASSGGTPSDPVVGLDDEYWLVSPINLGNNTRLYVKDDSFTDEWETEIIPLIDRGRHEDRGTHYGYVGSLTVQLFDGYQGKTAREQKQTIQRLVAQAEMLYLRTPFGDVFQVASGDLQFGRTPGVGLREHGDLTFPYTEIA